MTSLSSTRTNNENHGLATLLLATRWTAANQFSLRTLVDNTLAHIVCKFERPSFTQLGETNEVATAHFHYLYGYRTRVVHALRHGNRKAARAKSGAQSVREEKLTFKKFDLKFNLKITQTGPFVQFQSWIFSEPCLSVHGKRLKDSAIQRIQVASNLPVPSMGNKQST